jgi:hypothetical protein
MKIAIIGREDFSSSPAFGLNLLTQVGFHRNPVAEKTS